MENEISIKHFLSPSRSYSNAGIWWSNEKRSREARVTAPAIALRQTKVNFHTYTRSASRSTLPFNCRNSVWKIRFFSGLEFNEGTRVVRNDAIQSALFFIITTIINLIRCCLIEQILFLSFSRLSGMFMFVFIIMGNWWCGHWGWLFDCLVIVQDTMKKANFMTFERNEKTLKTKSLKKFHSISQKDVKRILVTHLTWWKTVAGTVIDTRSFSRKWFWGFAAG